jgi:hypothetical protein
LGKPIPPQIVEQVLDLWLAGRSIREIAQSLEIGVGTVHAITKQFALKDKNHHLLHTLAISLGKNGLDVVEYAWLVRLSKILRDAGATTNQVEEIISELPVYCFKAGIDVEILVDLLKKFKAYLEANPSDPAQTNLIVESYNMAVENCKISQSGKLEDVLKIVLTDDKVRELNVGHFVQISKAQTVERIIDVIKNPSDYRDLFFGGAKTTSSLTNNMN